MELDELIRKLMVESARIEQLKKGGGLPDFIIDLIIGVGSGLLTRSPLGVIGGVGLDNLIKDIKRKSEEEYDYLYNQIYINKIGLTREIEVLSDLYKIGLSESTPNLQQRLMEYIQQKNISITMYDTWLEDIKRLFEALNKMRIVTSGNIPLPPNYLDELEDTKDNVKLWAANLAAAAKKIMDEEKKRNDINRIWPTQGKRDPFKRLRDPFLPLESERDPFLPLKDYTKKEKGFDLSSGFSSYIDDIMSLYNIPGLSSGILEGSAGQSFGSGFSLLQSSGGSAGSGFTIGEGINIPLQYEIEVTGLEQFESIKENAEEAGEAVEESRDSVSNFSSEMMKQFLNLKEEQRAALSVDMSMLPLNMMGIGGAPFQFSMPTEESKEFSETLSNITGIADQLGGFGAGLAKRRLIYLESFSDSYNFNA